MAESKNPTGISLDGKILFRSITPLPDCRLPGNNTLFPLISGTRHGDAYKVYLTNSNGWEQAQSSALEYWPAEQLRSSREFIEHFSRIGMCNQFLIVDHIVDDTSETRVMHNSQTSIKVLSATINALILHHGAQGPYIENTWELQFPLSGIGRSWSLVSMNRFLCTSTHFVATSSCEFSATFNALLDKPWGDSQFGRVLDIALDTLSGSLRILRPSHSFALLAMAFEILFTKCENDFSGGSKRLARLTGNTKAEVASLQQFLTGEDANSVRKLRNRVIHGNESIDNDKLNSVRVEFAGLMAQATIFLIHHFAATALAGNYYDELEKLAEHRFSGLPTHHV